MAYKITDSCVACGTCIGECPTEAISAGDIYVIDPDKVHRLRYLRRRLPERGYHRRISNTEKSEKKHSPKRCAFFSSASL